MRGYTFNISDDLVPNTKLIVRFYNGQKPHVLRWRLPNITDYVGFNGALWWYMHRRKQCLEK